mmetsp:Transcript_110531/g.293630  ORF Transcript_110531/g.293630 Transcript_110531/m.293630 type:complete len:289 (+) Transcript_110531:924-1790(+)
MSGHPSSVISWKSVKRERNMLPNHSWTSPLSRRYGSRDDRRVSTNAKTYNTAATNIMNQIRARNAPQSACTNSTSFWKWRKSRNKRRIRSIRKSRAMRNTDRARRSNCDLISGMSHASVMLTSTSNKSKMFHGLLGHRCFSASILSTTSTRKMTVQIVSEMTHPIPSFLCLWSVSTTTTTELIRISMAKTPSKKLVLTQLNRLSCTEWGRSTSLLTSLLQCKRRAWWSRPCLLPLLLRREISCNELVALAGMLLTDVLSSCVTSFWMAGWPEAATRTLQPSVSALTAI